MTNILNLARDILYRKKKKMPRLFESYSAPVMPDSDNLSIYTAQWGAQTFTTGGLAHSITSVKIWADRFGVPGTVTVSIRNVNSAGKPTGSDLTSVTIDSSLIEVYPIFAQYEFAVPEIIVQPNTLYAIVIRTAGGDVVNRIDWVYGHGGITHTYPVYNYGKAWRSFDLGVTWAAASFVLPFMGFVFEIWGNDGKVSTSDTTSSVVSSEGTRVRTISHVTILTPWIA